MNILISGAGIAGPTLAFWLCKSGHKVVLVENSPRLRREGYVIDFWGLGYDIAERMGLVPRIKELGYQVKEVQFVNRHGRQCGGFATDVFARSTKGRFTTLRRSDLAATIFDALDGNAETIFDDSVTQIDDEADGVQVAFRHANSRKVDLVIGADGLHSQVRQLAFRADASTEVSLGYHVAAFEVTGYRPREELVYVSYGIPGRQVSRFSLRDDKTLFLFVFQDKYLDASLRAERGSDEQSSKSALNKVFGDVGWECPQILAAMNEANEIYFDRVSQIRMKHWNKGRVALVGDAAACVSLLAGEGAGLAMAEAYVLAGEIHNSHDDHATAFARYQERLMPLLHRKQLSAAKFASSFAPTTSLGLAFRNLVTRFLRFPLVADFFVGRDLRDDFELPDYGGFGPQRDHTHLLR